MISPSINYVQYGGGCEVRRRHTISTDTGVQYEPYIINTEEAHHQYRRRRAACLQYRPTSSVWMLIYWVTQKVLLFDTSLNNGLLFHCLNIFRFWISVYKIRYWYLSDANPLKAFWRYTNLNIESRFHDIQNLRNFGWSIFAERQIVADGHLWALGVTLS